MARLTNGCEPRGASLTRRPRFFSARALSTLTLAALTLTWGRPLGAGAATVRVPDDYPTIQLALDQASPGDSVLVAPGTYQEMISFPSGVVLASESGPDSTRLLGTGVGAGAYFSQAADSTVLQGFTVEGYVDGIVAEGGSPRVEGNLFVGNSTAGIDITLGSDAAVVGNLVTANTKGIMCDGNSSPLLRENTLVMNATGVAAYPGAAPAFENNLIVLNEFYGIYGLGTTPTFTCNDVWGNGVDYGGDISDPTGSGGNVSEDPLLCGAYLGRFGLREGSPCAEGAPGGCGRRGARGVECLGRTWVVSQSGAGDVATIQGGLNGAVPPDTVLVMAGIYGENLNLGSALVVEGCEGVENTVVEPGGAAPGLTVTGVDSAGLFRGLTIRGGDSTAVCITGGSTARLEDLLITENAAGVSASSSAPRLSRVTVTSSTGDAVRLTAGSQPLIDHSLIAGNGGAGIRGEGGASAELGCCDVYANQGGDYVGIDDPTGLGGNISLDPLFCDAQNGGYSLRAGSPCLPDTGGCGRKGALGQGCLARVWRVTAVGDGEAPTVQAGIDSCVPGDTVRAAPGVYGESVQLAAGVILQGELGADETLLVPGGGADGIVAVSLDSTCLVAGVTVEGFSGAGIVLQNSVGTRVSGCTLGENGVGVQVLGGWARVDSSLFRENGFGARAEGGILEATGCTWYHQGETGVFVGATGTAEMERCIVAQSQGTGIEVISGGSSILSCNDVWANAGGDYVGTVPGTGDFSADPLFCDPSLGDFRLDVDSPCTPENSGGCDLVGAREIGCGGGVSVSETETGLPEARLAIGASPLPLGPAGTVSLCIPEPGGRVSLALYDVRGRRLWHERPARLAPGRHFRRWPLTEELTLAPGIYFLHASSERECASARIVVLR